MKRAPARARFIPDQAVEREASTLLSRYGARSGRLGLPIPIERIVEDVLDLRILWDQIERDDASTLAGLSPQKRLILYNEAARGFIEGRPGLYETVLGHEAGHWVLHADRGAEFQGALPGLSGEYVCKYREITAEQGSEEIQAHKFMGYVLLPADLLRPLVVGRDLLQWSVLYELREACGVTISALVRRLEGLGLLYVDENHRLYPSKEVARGQGALF